MEPPEDIELITLNPVQEYEVLSKIYWLIFPILPWMLYSIFKLRRFDVIITHRYPFTVASYFASMRNTAEYVFWSHPPTDSTDAFSGLAKIWFWFIHTFETKGKSVARADHVIAVSKDSKTYIESFIEQDVLTVPNKINERRFKEKVRGEKLRRKYGIEQSEKIVLFVGRITERKNIEKLIEIFEESTKDIQDSKLVIAGSATQTKYAELIKEQSSPRIIFTGYVSDPILSGLYSTADVFATCSLEEGWGLPITEADYFDTPVVAFESHPAVKYVDNSYVSAEGDYDEFRRMLLRALNESSM
jgi:1,2-diacylglycerol 3-alpha-glucosyltransferase